MTSHAGRELDGGDVRGCLACDATAGRVAVPGGRIHATRHWTVEHCLGPLGVGTLVVKPLRHVVHLADLTPGEAGELGGLLHLAARVVQTLADPEQTYVCLWSHAGAAPGHVHFVVQPVGRALMDEHGSSGPALQVAMFAAGAGPDQAAVEAFAEQARALLGAL
jgi:diadenosine tetraphosphate (Ap4A) HIT family hydrolase